MTSRLDVRQLVEALSTNLLRVMQCDVSALLLPDSESGALRVTILHNPDARGPFREGSLVPMNSSISGQVLRKATSVRIDSFEHVREDPEIYGTGPFWSRLGFWRSTGEKSHASSLRMHFGEGQRRTRCVDSRSECGSGG